MVIKLLIILICGTVETFLYTAWCLSANRKEITKSSLLMTVYMMIYLGIISYAIKDTNTGLLIFTYAISCGIGNYLELLWEKRRK
jgi:uncharacterized membrane protein YwaF